MLDLARAKAHLRVLNGDEDALIGAYLAAAKRWAENFTGRIIGRREVVRHFSGFGSGIVLLDGPDPEVTSVSYLDAAGDAQTFADYRVVNGEPAALLLAVGASWPSVGNPAGIEVTLTAGYADDEIPEDLEAAILLMAGHLYANRETVTDGAPSEVPFGSTILAHPYRSILI
jgi:uncharacterized phiE125 gp8 family phage protein